MKKVGTIFTEMGFRSDAPESLKEAFVRHLIKSATGYEVAPGPNERRQIATQGLHIRVGEQLSFDFTEIEQPTIDQTAVKKSS